MARRSLLIDCLNGICDDYENIDSIHRQVEKARGESVARKDIVATVLRLINDGLADGFAYDLNRQSFRLAEIPVCDQMENLWFMINGPGRHYLDSYWNDNTSDR